VDNRGVHIWVHLATDSYQPIVYFQSNVEKMGERYVTSLEDEKEGMKGFAHRYRISLLIESK
jgi:hypothetical protein